MPRYRITYIESSLRVRVVEARSAKDAKKIRHEFEDGYRHQILDGWDDDWQTQLLSGVPSPSE